MGANEMTTEVLTHAKRLAYIVPHAQRPSSGVSWTEGGTCSDEQNDSRGADQPCAPSSHCSLGEQEGKERVTQRRTYMTRSSFQKGYVFSRTTRHGRVHGIRYRVRTTDGTWKHKAESVNSPRRKDAQKILAERLREVNRGLKLPVETSFQQFSADHWETYVSQNLKPSTQASHRSNLRTHLLPAFGKLRLSEISPLQIMDLLKEKEASGLKPKSRLNLYVLLQKMLNLAVALELLNTNPIRRVPKPRVERVEKPSLSPAQVKAIADNMPEHLKALIVVLYLTGLRIGEALALKWCDVDFENSRLCIRRSVWHRTEQTPKSRRSIRAKHLLDGLEQVLRRHRELCVQTEPEA